MDPQLPIHNVLRLAALRCRMQINYRKRKKRKRGMQIIILMVECICLSCSSFRLPPRTTFENISTSLLHRFKLRAASCQFNSIRPFRLLACRLFTLHSSSPSAAASAGEASPFFAIAENTRPAASPERVHMYWYAYDVHRDSSYRKYRPFYE